MVEQAESALGERVEITLADGGYHTAANLEAGAKRGQTFVMPERYHKGVQGPYFKDRFIYDPTTDGYLCPQGQRLPFRGIAKEREDSGSDTSVQSFTNRMSRLSSLWGVRQRQALRQSPMDWTVRCSAAKASGVDAHRGASKTVLPTKRTGRASLWHTQGTDGCQKVPAKGPCQRESRVHSVGSRIQPQDLLSHTLHI